MENLLIRQSICRLGPFTMQTCIYRGYQSLKDIHARGVNSSKLNRIAIEDKNRHYSMISGRRKNRGTPVKSSTVKPQKQAADEISKQVRRQILMCEVCHIKDQKKLKQMNDCQEEEQLVLQTTAMPSRIHCSRWYMEKLDRHANQIIIPNKNPG